MKFRTITILFLMITAIGCMAQRRQLQEARLILKGDKDYDKAEKTKWLSVFSSYKDLWSSDTKGLNKSQIEKLEAIYNFIVK